MHTTFVPVVIAKVQSASNPSKHYEIRMGKDGNTYCTCPAWKFQKASPIGRTCKHLRAFAARATLPGASRIVAKA